jgi:uncharacterized protein YndB with AHSA1/START domain
MKLAAKYDVEAPVDFVFRELMDFDAWERMAMRRGADVMRTDTLPKPGPGMEWLVHFLYRGKTRSAQIRLATATPSHLLVLTLRSALIDSEIVIELLDLAVSRTRITVKSEVKPKSIAARIYMQTLRLARKKVDATYAQRIAQLAVEMEDRYRRPSLR